MKSEKAENRVALKRLPWWKWIVILFLTALLGGLLFWIYYRKQIVRQELESAVWDGTDGLYRISYAEMFLDEWNGKIRFRDLMLDFDSARQQELVSLERSPNFLVRIKIPELEISGVETPRALLAGELKAAKIRIQRPELTWIGLTQPDSTGADFPSNEELMGLLGKLQRLEIGKIEIVSGNMVKHQLNGGSDSLDLKNVSLQLGSVLIDSSVLDDPNRILFAEELELQLEKFSWRTADSLYNGSLMGVHFESREQQLKIDSFRFTPLLTERYFMQQHRNATDRVDCVLEGLKLEGIDLALATRDTIQVDSITIRKGFVKLYRDLALPHDGRRRVGTYPHQLLNEMGYAIFINSVVANSLLVEYKERNPGTRKSGAVRFEETELSIRQLANFLPEGPSQAPIKMTTRSLFMGAASLVVDWQFYPKSENGRFSIRGRLAAVPRNQLNQLIEPLGSARMENGRLKSLHFSLEGNDYRMGGQVALAYSDLKIAVLSQQPEKNPSKKVLASMLANMLTRSNNKEDDDGRALSYTVTNRRDPTRSIFHLTWKTLFKGIKANLGIKK